MKKSQVIHYPKGLEVSYKVELLKLIDAIEIEFYKEITALLDEYFNRDDFVDDIEIVFERLAVFSQEKASVVIAKLTPLLANVVRIASNQVKRSLRDTDAFENILLDDVEEINSTEFIQVLPILELNELIRNSVSINTKLVKSIPAELLEDLSYVIEDGFRTGLSLEELNKSIVSKFDISKNRASVIARTEIAKLHSNTLRDEYLKLGIENYEWYTSNDERVRASHKVLNKKICNWNDATIYKNKMTDKEWKKKSSISAVEKQVGEDFQCRCSVIAILNQN